MTLLNKGIGLLFAITLTTACTVLNQKKDNNTQGKTSEPEPPKITKPIVKRIWIKDAISEDGTEYSTGHWKYILENKSVWSK